MKNVFNFLGFLMVISSCFLLLFVLSLEPRGTVDFVGYKVGQAIGVSNSASVPANPMNTLAAQLKEKEERLTQREETLANMEGDLLRITSVKYNRLLWVSITFLSFLFFLLISNYLWDHKRRKHLEEIEHDLEEEIDELKHKQKEVFQKG